MTAETKAPSRLGRWLEADRRYTNRLRIAERPGWRRKVASILAHSGDSWFWVPGLMAVWWFGGAEAKLLAVRLLIAIGVAIVIVFLVKRRVKRARPEGEWGSFYRRTDPHSFPSGHAARMAMLALLAAGLGTGWFAWLMLVWAPLAGMARVTMGVHYLSDVIGGVVLGIVVGVVMLIVF